MSVATKKGFAASVAVATSLLAWSNSWAGQEPFVATVGKDIDMPTFYVSDLLRQFLHTNNHSAYNAERFTTNVPVNKPEICDTEGFFDQQFFFRGNTNGYVPSPNAGFFEWTIVLPKKPQSDLNIVVQCGILKPGSFTREEFNAILVCAGEEGERANAQCDRELETPGRSPVVAATLPTLTVLASPGPFPAPGWPPAPDNFYLLTAWRQPSAFSYARPPAPVPPAPPQTGTNSMTVLLGLPDNRVVLKACNAESFLAKFPVTGFINFLGQTERDLEAGDRITVRMTIPRGHTMDIYCHRNSVRIQGMGIPDTLLP